MSTPDGVSLLVSFLNSLSFGFLGLLGENEFTLEDGDGAIDTIVGFHFFILGTVFRLIGGVNRGTFSITHDEVFQLNAGEDLGFDNGSGGAIEFSKILVLLGIGLQAEIFVSKDAETIINHVLGKILGEVDFKRRNVDHRLGDIDGVISLVGLFLNGIFRRDTIILKGFGGILNNRILFNPSVDEIVEFLHAVVHIGHIVSGNFFNDGVLAVFSLILLGLQLVERGLPFVQIRYVRIGNLFEESLVFGDLLFVLLDPFLPEVNLVDIFEAFSVPNEVGLSESFLRFDNLILGVHDHERLVDIGVVSGLILVDGGLHSGFLVGGQILGSEGDVAEGVTESFLSLGEVFLVSNHVDLVLGADFFHRQLDAFDFGSDFSLKSLKFFGGSFEFQFGEPTFEGLHLDVAFGFSLDLVGLGLTKSGFSSLDLGAGTLEFSVSSTQVFQRADVFSFGVAEVLDALRLDLLNTGSEKTAGSNHDHQ